MPSATPIRLRNLVQRCLERDIKMRLRDIGEARLELARIKVTGTVGDARNYYQMRLSPDGRRVATSVGDFTSSMLSVLDLGNGVSSAVTDGQAVRYGRRTDRRWRTTPAPTGVVSPA